MEDVGLRSWSWIDLPAMCLEREKDRVVKTGFATGCLRSAHLSILVMLAGAGMALDFVTDYDMRLTSAGMCV